MAEVIFDFDTVHRKAQLRSPHLVEIREVLSVEDKAQFFMKRRLGRNIPTRKYAISNCGYFDIPFFDEICRQIKANFPSLQIEATESFMSQAKVPALANKYLPLGLEPRDYQHESTTEILKHGRGVIVLPTSAGKTLVIGLVANTCAVKNKQKVLILVPNIQLVQQTYSDLLEYGVDPGLVSRWTGNHEYEATNIVIANSQILLSKTQDVSVLKRFQVVIADEVHRYSTADKSIRLLRNLQCQHMIGLTGSLPENKFDIWSINRLFGDVVYRKKSVDLRNDLYISKVRVVGLEMDYRNIPHFTRATMSDPTVGYEEEITWLQTKEFRNQTIAKLVDKLETNTLVLVDRIAHGELLQEYLEANTGKQVFFVQGSVEVEDREKIRELMESTQGVVCVAISKIFSTGINIKNLHNIIFAAIGKARIKIIQSIGRSLRLHASKEMATIFDVADVCLKYGLDHFEERKHLYETEKIPLITKRVVEPLSV